MRYIFCKIKEKTKERIYKSYVTDCLSIIASNTAKMGGGTVTKKSYSEIIKKIDELDVDNKKVKKPKSADSIIFGIVAKGGLKLKR